MCSVCCYKPIWSELEGLCMCIPTTYIYRDNVLT